MVWARILYTSTQETVTMQGKIHWQHVPNSLLLVNCIMALVYLAWWVYLPHMDNPLLYCLLFIGEIYHVGMAIGFWYTMWDRKQKKKTLTLQPPFPTVAIFITVAGEPVEIVAKTVRAAKNLTYTGHSVYVLNDGFVAGKDNWREMEDMAEELGVVCITRRQGGGAKAGNINNALRQTESEFISILDADMAPHRDFLKRLMPYFSNPDIAFVQSPQYYKNHSKNNITSGAWEQQHFFFGPIMQGKDSLNSAFICGTNVIIRRRTLDEVGGINEHNIAEDFLTSLFIHKRGWKSVYVPDVLCEGLAPEDLLSYYKQQQRWARGSLEVAFRYNPFFLRGLTFGQRIQYLLSAFYYLNGLVVLIDMLMPLLFLFAALQPVTASTTTFALFFVPYIFITLYTLYFVSDGTITFRAMSFSQSSWTIQLSALAALIFRQDIGFSVTAKQAKTGNFLFLVYPHLAYILLTIIGIVYHAYVYGVGPALVTNSAWAIFNDIMFLPFIHAAYRWKEISPSEATVNIITQQN